jgi:two-component system sensor histidine kinase EvgS
VLYALIVAIAVVDWFTAAGVVVGVLFCVPILWSSAGDDRRQVLIVTALSIAGFILAAIFGRGPMSVQAVWLPNRLLALASIVASAPLALMLQRRRIAAEAARRQAESEQQVNALLNSLMAHDLRAPLGLARDFMSAVDAAVKEQRPVDLELLSEVDARLRRSLRAIELVLGAARRDIEGKASGPRGPVVNIAAEIRSELQSFEHEATQRNKRLVLFESTPSLQRRVDAAVLRQVIAILIDNAIRYSSEGDIRIDVAANGKALCVSVRDAGPGLTAHRRTGAGGEGLGLRLCELLARQAGGSLGVVNDSAEGTEFVLSLPELS